VTQFITADTEGIETARKCLTAGGIVAFPTESSYALGASVQSTEAMNRLAHLKNRPSDQGFPILAPSTDYAASLIENPNGPAWDLAKKSWPGGLTLVTKTCAELSHHVTTKLGAGIRVTKHPWSQELVESFGGPVTCTSANLRGGPPALGHEEIPAAVAENIDMIIKGSAGREPVSTVITPRAWGIEVLRQGPIEVERSLHITGDRILRGRVFLLQPKVGYRFSIDALLLAGFVKDCFFNSRNKEVSALELGTGCGVVSLCLAKRLDEIPLDFKITAYELQERLGSLAELNASLNGMSNQISIIQEDFKTGLPNRACENTQMDLVFSNPPYRPVGTGRQSPCKEKELALGESACSMEDIAMFGSGALKHGGALCVIYPAKRLSQLTRVFGANNLFLNKIRPVYARPGCKANRVLALFLRGESNRSTELLEPLTLYQSNGEETAELKDITG